jgi:5-methyltetrahydrofolate--homocysteine methyltransferase
MMAKKSIVLLDGSCGSALWNMADRKGIAREPVWKYNITHPELVEELVRSYISAGADMLQTDTFSLNRFSAEKEPGFTVADTVRAAAAIALDAAKETGQKVYLSSGPLPMLLEPYGKLSAAKCRESYDEIFAAASAFGIKAAALETFMDIRMMEIAARSALDHGMQVFCSMTFEKRHRTLMGDTVAKICETLQPLNPSAVGMNCSYGPVGGLEIIREFREHTDLPLYFKPNAGMETTYTKEQFVQEIRPAFEFVTYIGGCCGTGADYIACLRQALDEQG